MSKGCLLWSVLALFVLFSCSGEQPKAPAQLKFQPNKYASYFKIGTYGEQTVVINYINADRTDSIVYGLYPGTELQSFPRNIPVAVPVTHAACMTSVFVGFIDRLNGGNIHDLVTAVDNMDFVSNETLNNLYREGKVKELAKNGELNLEQTIAWQPNIIFMNPTGDRKKDLDTRLIKARIIPVVIADYFESHPLARAEWIRFFGCLFGKEKEADSLFAETEKKYLALKATADTCKVKPRVFTELKTQDTWFVAGGESSTAKFLQDAGANYLWKDNGKTNVTAMNMEQVIEKALNADYWVNLHLCMSKDELVKLDKRYSEFKAFKNGNLYNNNALLNEKGGNAYWENGLCNPDEILSDLVEIFHPGLQPGKKLKYYRQLK